MSTLLWIVLTTFAMSLFAWVGLVTLYFNEKILRKIIFPLVAFSAGALLAGALLHMIPESIKKLGGTDGVFELALIGFAIFFLMEQFIHWHHCHKATSEHKAPVTYLILFSDALHNFIGGLGIGGAFLVDIRLGLITWLVAAAHEIPQEFGDFGILIHGGWEKKKALLFNFFSALSIVLGGLVAYFVSGHINIVYLLPFAAGNFIYIASSDLIPEVKNTCRVKDNLLHFLSFVVGIMLIYLIGFIE